jgi:hypothetical protein
MSVNVFASVHRNDVIPEIGDLIMYDPISGSGEVYDVKDNQDSIIGVGYPKVNQLGRIVANVDGLVYEEVEYFQYGEDRTYDFNTSNPSFDPSFNPSTDSNYVYVCTHGLAPVKVSSETLIPPSWVKIRNGVNYSIYLIR